MTTKEAFKQLMQQPSVWKLVNITIPRVLYFRNRIKTDKPVSIDKMEELLLKAGYKVKREKVWLKP